MKRWGGVTEIRSKGTGWTLPQMKARELIFSTNPQKKLVVKLVKFVVKLVVGLFLK